MKRTNAVIAVLAGVCLFQAGWILGSVGLGTAWADPADDEGSDELFAEPAAPYSAPFKCRHFPVDAKDKAVTLETADRTSEIGQWVGDQEDNGWTVYSVDFEVGTKPTGFPQGWVQVCLIPG